MGVPFDDFKSRFQGALVKCIRELAQSAADGRDQTTLPQLAPTGVTFPPGGPSNLCPETEGLICADFQPVDVTDCYSQVLNLARHERNLSFIAAGRQASGGLR